MNSNVRSDRNELTERKLVCQCVTMSQVANFGGTNQGEEISKGPQSIYESRSSLLKKKVICSTTSSSANNETYLHGITIGKRHRQAKSRRIHGHLIRLFLRLSSSSQHQCYIVNVAQNFLFSVRMNTIGLVGVSRLPLNLGFQIVFSFNLYGTGRCSL